MRARLFAIGAACVCLAGQAWADDAQPAAPESQSGYVTVTPHQPVPAAPSRHEKAHASRDKGASTSHAPEAARPVPTEPKSVTSFTGGWKASSDQGNGLMGGLKIGF